MTRKIRLFMSCLAVGLAPSALIHTASSESWTRETTTEEIAFVQEPRIRTEAPTGFDAQTNGIVDQATMNAARQVFEKVQTEQSGLGPVLNSNTCTVCHLSPTIGGGSLILTLRAGRFDATRQQFIAHPGGSLIQASALSFAILETVQQGYNVQTFRTSPSLFGLGYVEAIGVSMFGRMIFDQRRLSGGRIVGEHIRVNVLESPARKRLGRFGWKNQHASLLSFASEANLDEIGITSPLHPVENTSNGDSVIGFDSASDPEDDGSDMQSLATFIRALKAPPRDTMLAITPEAQAGAQIFERIGCALCHVSTITTLPPGTLINGGSFPVPPALGDKIIHPYSDFLLHDVGTGDGIVQNGGLSTRNKIRTAPLWGLRTRTQFMHDGGSSTHRTAILRHSGEAAFVIDQYRLLNGEEVGQLLAFLRSL
jgi:CxxC motif-containing protein (DUF1111 family)